MAALHGKPKSSDAQFDDFEWRDLLGASRSGYRHSRTALNFGLQAVAKTPSQRGRNLVTRLEKNQPNASAVGWIAVPLHGRSANNQSSTGCVVDNSVDTPVAGD
jgi:hypothetical protein